MIDDHDIARLDEIYVRKEDCQGIQSAVEKELANDSTRFAVLEYQQKLNNWLTGAICGGIIALLIKVYLGGITWTARPVKRKERSFPKRLKMCRNARHVGDREVR